MSQANAILGLLAQTSLHAGTGQNTGTIDLPIQREGHNGWPCVFGSAVKGALRTAAEERKSGNVSVVYGPGPKGSTSDHAGAIAVGDARLLLLPVRSLTSQFRWVTCYDALLRYSRDRERLGLQGIQGVVPDAADTNGQSDAVVHGDEAGDAQPLFLEEYRFQVRSRNLDNVIEALSSLMRRDEIAEALKKQLVIVSNDSFAHLTQHATPVNAHIAIDSKTKTVTGGALWYEETLPPETLLYVPLTANDGRAPVELGASKLDASDVLKEVTGLFAEYPWFQLGGNETVGMGWCAVETVMPPVTQTGGQEG